jgi:hypothetical protein
MAFDWLRNYTIILYFLILGSREINPDNIFLFLYVLKTKVLNNI